MKKIEDKGELIMGNSIEEDMKIIDNFITYFNKNIQDGYRADLTILGEEIEALEHILSDYKRVLKENEELKIKEFQLHLATEEMKSMIYKQKVKDKIEELNNSKENYTFYRMTSEDIRRTVITNLQELIEGKGE